MATSPKVISIMSRYLESYKGDQVTYDIDSDAPPTKATIDNLNTGGLDQIVENEEEEEEPAASYATSLALKNKLMSLQAEQMSAL